MLRKLLPFTLLILLFIPIKLKNKPPEHFDDIKEEIVMNKEFSCLVENIYHESKGESMKGKLGVAQITLNRVEQPGFPGTICGVVHEKKRVKKNKKIVTICQFQWVCDKSKKMVYNEAYEDSILIANAAINGVKIDELSHSLFFHADYVNPKWKKKSIIKIGKHIFYE